MKKLIFLIVLTLILASGCDGVNVIDDLDRPVSSGDGGGAAPSPSDGVINENPDNDNGNQNEPEPIDPAPDMDNYMRGNATVGSADIAVMESYPVQISLSLHGSLPTPCNQLVVEFAEPNDQNQIHVEVYSVVEKGKICMQVIEMFEQNVSVPTENLADGTYTVWVNGDLVGEFSYPG